MSAVAASVLLLASPAGASPSQDLDTKSVTVKVKATSSIKIIDQGITASGGWVAYTGVGKIVVDGTDGVVANGISARGVQEVGGGIWSYGSSFNWVGQKNCYSQYQHETVSHGSSVLMDSIGDSDWRLKGTVAASKVTAFTTATCYAYWRK
ncbi:lactococcin 972 family bacteriocin [Nocardioides sp. InS609-2]|uniref:lactococcin 972 family bacteriocin n=1 Tax=Nocardioides sp. InS609-2 TaxID=2760705 RepID=UPI0020BEDF69|nr:lactococcin 972 family bacteriocin [Nocardioides sp. InS609-2]